MITKTLWVVQIIMIVMKLVGLPSVVAGLSWSIILIPLWIILAIVIVAWIAVIAAACGFYRLMNG